MADFIIHTVADEGDLVVLAPYGCLDAAGANELKARCASALEGGCRSTILDLSRIEMISSTGVGALLMIHENFTERGGHAFLAALSPEVRSVLRCMDLDRVVRTVETVEEARRLLYSNATKP